MRDHSKLFPFLVEFISIEIMVPFWRVPVLVRVDNPDSRTPPRVHRCSSQCRKDWTADSEDFVDIGRDDNARSRNKTITLLVIMRCSKQGIQLFEGSSRARSNRSRIVGQAGAHPGKCGVSDWCLEVASTVELCAATFWELCTRASGKCSARWPIRTAFLVGGSLWMNHRFMPLSSRHHVGGVVHYSGNCSAAASDLETYPPSCFTFPLVAQ